MLDLDYLHRLREQYADALHAPVAGFQLRGKSFPNSGVPNLMGVVNLSPDSWYRESVCLSTAQAIRRGQRLAAEGADIIDIGAESTILNAKTVDESAQTNALLPVIQELSEAGILVSAETYHPAVAEACLKAGAAVLNLTGIEASKDIYRQVADYDAGVIICYMQGKNVRNVGDFQLAEDHTRALLDYFSRQIELAVKSGVKRIWIDPGLGFYYKNLQDSATRVRYQMQTFLNTFRLRKLGWPTCHALPHAFEYFEDEVRSAEAFFAVLAVLGKTNLLRTHEIGKVAGVVRTLDVL
ncbi:MAG: dihydropteroate synthase [Methylacidiphilales bacterium]|nr:dihydropteroate synthase [Candidatus Methylacidiphilales bacterium]